MATTLAGTVALVTGASSGIGAATAKALGDQGAAIALVARRRPALDEVARQIREEGGSAVVVEADISDHEQAAVAVRSAAEHLGRLDIVVNNAGVMLTGPVAEAPAEEWDQMVRVNVQGLLHVTRAAIPHLVRAANDSPRGVADLVTISSTAGRVARPGTAVYSLTKFGVGAFSESLRQELQSQRVRVAVVEPGTVDTELASHLRPGIREAVAQQVRGMQMLQPADIADSVTHIVTRDRRVAVNEMLVRASEQTW